MSNSMLFPMSFKRQFSGSLDSDEVFTSLSDLKTYANGATSYVGQLCKVVNTSTNEVFLYVILPDKTLLQVITDVGGIQFKDVLNTKAELLAKTNPSNGDLYIIKADESFSGSPRKGYIYSNASSAWEVLDETTDRDFTTNPLDIDSQTSGTLPITRVNTTTLVPKTDIVNDLITTDSQKVLSANQGTVIKGLVDTKTQINDTATTSTTETYSIDKIISLLNDKQNKITISNIAPTSPQTNDLWIDTTNASQYALKCFNVSWIQIGSTSSGSGVKVWTNGSKYDVNDLVVFNANLYLTLNTIANSTSDPSVDTTNFKLVGGSGGTYTNSNPVPTTIGGITSGTTFNNASITSVLDQLLYPYQLPTFGTFTITGLTNPMEVGASLSANPTFTWSTINSTNISANTIKITDVTNSNTVLVTGSANDGTETVTLSAITKSNATSHQFKIEATDTKSNIFNKTLTVNWQWKRYYGELVNSTLVEADIKGLRVNGLSSGFAGTYNFNAGGYKYICYPSVLGNAISFKDTSTNLDVAMSPVYTVSVTNSNGIATNYNVHRTLNQIGSAINIIVA